MEEISIGGSVSNLSKATRVRRQSQNWINVLALCSSSLWLGLKANKEGFRYDLRVSDEYKLRSDLCVTLEEY